MIEIKNLVFRYPRGDFELRIEELRIDVGSKVAIVGPSGSGKTTLLNLMSGIVVPDSGEVVVCQTDVGKLNDRSRRDFRISNIGLVFQRFELVEYLQVTDNILLPYFINPSLQRKESARQRAKDLAIGMGLEGKLRRFPHQLSQGEQQRLSLIHI